MGRGRREARQLRPGPLKRAIEPLCSSPGLDHDRTRSKPAHNSVHLAMDHLPVIDDALVRAGFGKVPRDRRRQFALDLALVVSRVRQVDLRSAPSSAAELSQICVSGGQSPARTHQAHALPRAPASGTLIPGAHTDRITEPTQRPSLNSAASSTSTSRSPANPSS
jgi:hypothetical protein